MKFQATEGNIVSLDKRKPDTLRENVVPGKSWRAMLALDSLFASASY
jgi:hypothetical protein